VSEMPFELVETFRHRNRTCIIVRNNMIDEMSHNGYVTVAPRNHGCDYIKVNRRINTKCLTFAGTLPVFGFHDHQYFVGFDTMHLRKDVNPEIKTYASVRAKTIKLADEMVEKGI